MAIYTVLAPPPKSADGRPEPTELAFVKEGFCFPALFFPILWLLFRRLWLVLVGYVALLIGLGIAAANVGSLVPITVFLLARFLLALEANELRRGKLYRAGCRLIGIAEGDSRGDAELRFFLAWDPGRGRPPTSPSASPPESPAFGPAPETNEVVGLFPAPGGVR